MKAANFIFLLGLIPVPLAAQAPAVPDIIDPSHADTRSLNQSGILLSVRLEPGEPIRLYVAGQEDAQFDPSQLTLTVRGFSPEGNQALSTHLEGDHFIIDPQPDLPKLSEIEVTAKTPREIKVFHFKLSTRP